MNWYDRFATPAWDNWFRSQARKKFGFNEDLEQEAYEYAILKMYERMNKITDPLKQTDSYCRVIYRRKLIDVHRHYLKRFQPHKWVKDKGPPWPETAKLLYFGYSLEDIRTILLKDIKEDYSIDELRSIIEELYQRPYGQLYPLDVGDNITQAPDKLLFENERYCFVRFLLNKNDDEDDPESPIKILKSWQNLRQKIRLDDTERLILKLRFYEGMSYGEIADELKDFYGQEYKNTNEKTLEKTIERRIKNILEKIRDLFAQEGIRLGDL